MRPPHNSAVDLCTGNRLCRHYVGTAFFVAKTGRSLVTGRWQPTAFSLPGVFVLLYFILSASLLFALRHRGRPGASTDLSSIIPAQSTGMMRGGFSPSYTYINMLHRVTGTLTIVIEPVSLTGCEVIATPFEFYDAY